MRAHPRPTPVTFARTNRVCPRRFWGVISAVETLAGRGDPAGSHIGFLYKYGGFDFRELSPLHAVYGGSTILPSDKCALKAETLAALGDAVTLQRLAPRLVGRRQNEHRALVTHANKTHTKPIQSFYDANGGQPTLELVAILVSGDGDSREAFMMALLDAEQDLVSWIFERGDAGAIRVLNSARWTSGCYIDSLVIDPYDGQEVWSAWTHAVRKQRAETLALRADEDWAEIAKKRKANMLGITEADPVRRDAAIAAAEAADPLCYERSETDKKRKAAWFGITEADPERRDAAIAAAEEKTSLIACEAAEDEARRALEKAIRESGDVGKARKAVKKAKDRRCAKASRVRAKELRVSLATTKAELTYARNVLACHPDVLLALAEPDRVAETCRDLALQWGFTPSAAAPPAAPPTAALARGRRGRAARGRAPQEVVAETVPWVQCDDCDAWRELPAGAAAPEGRWSCAMDPWGPWACERAPPDALLTAALAPTVESCVGAPAPAPAPSTAGSGAPAPPTAPSPEPPPDAPSPARAPMDVDASLVAPSRFDAPARPPAPPPEVPRGSIAASPAAPSPVRAPLSPAAPTPRSGPFADITNAMLDDVAKIAKVREFGGPACDAKAAERYLRRANGNLDGACNLAIDANEAAAAAAARRSTVGRRNAKRPRAG